MRGQYVVRIFEGNQETPAAFPDRDLNATRPVPSMRLRRAESARDLFHHVQERSALYEQVISALTPVRRFFSSFLWPTNPVINQNRQMATEVRTPDESPLEAANAKLVRRYFPDTQIAVSGSGSM